jgi:hypothetical protein
MRLQMMRVISSPSSSTTGFLTLILDIEENFLRGKRGGKMLLPV